MGKLVFTTVCGVIVKFFASVTCPQEHTTTNSSDNMILIFLTVKHITSFI